MISAAQGGLHEDGRETYGHSIIVDPWGRVLAEAGTEPGVILAEIDPALVGEARSRIPALRHGRPFEVVRALSEDAPRAAEPDQKLQRLPLDMAGQHLLFQEHRSVGGVPVGPVRLGGAGGQSRQVLGLRRRAVRHVPVQSRGQVTGTP